jgi:hypothetical protein
MSQTPTDNKNKKSNQKMTRAATGALWNIEGPQRPVTGVASKSEELSDASDVIENGKSKDSNKNSKNKNKLRSDSDDGQHIMISYDWHHKEPVRKMNTALQALGYRTWLDVEQMSAS